MLSGLAIEFCVFSFSGVEPQGMGILVLRLATLGPKCWPHVSLGLTTLVPRADYT